jgi:hypothetical protein
LGEEQRATELTRNDAEREFLDARMRGRLTPDE